MEAETASRRQKQQLKKASRVYSPSTVSAAFALAFWGCDPRVSLPRQEQRARNERASITTRPTVIRSMIAR